MHSSDTAISAQKKSTAANSMLGFGSLMLIYLLAEFAFNSWLLDTAGSGNLDRDALKRLEYTGRALAATGFTLMSINLLFGHRGYRLDTWRSLILAYGLLALGSAPLLFSEIWLQPGTPFADGSGEWLFLPLAGALLMIIAWQLRGDSVSGRVLLFLAIASATFTGMYHGQLILIERWLITPSSAEERLQAKHLNLLQAGYAQGIVALGDVKREAHILPEEKALLAFTGLLFSNNQSLIDQAVEQKSRIIGLMVERLASDSVDSEYARYQQQRARIISQTWDPYTRRVADYERAMAGLDAEAAKRWNRIIDQGESSWASYQQAQKQYQRMFDHELKSIYWVMDEFGRKMRLCYMYAGDKLPACIEKAEQYYQRRVQDNSSAQIPWQYWVNVMMPPDGVMSREYLIYLHRVFPRGGSPLYSVRMEDLAPRLAALPNPAAAELLKGYPPDLRSLGEFMARPETLQEIRQQLAREGIHMPANWRLQDRERFISAVKAEQRRRIEAEWQKGSKALIGSTMPIIHDYQRFEQHPAVQERLRKVIGQQDGMVNLTLTRHEFRQMHIVPTIELELRQELQRLATSAPYADGGEYAEDGKQAIRSIRIPAISLVLSLLFGMIGLGRLLIMLLMHGWVLLFPSTPPLLRHGIYTGLWTGVALLIVLLPFQMENRLTHSNMYQLYMQDMKQQHPGHAHAIDWLLHTQPLIYPIGSALRKPFAIADSGH